MGISTADAGGLEQSGGLGKQRKRGVAGKHCSCVIERRLRRLDLERTRAERSDERQQSGAQRPGGVDAKEGTIEKRRALGSRECLERMQHADLSSDRPQRCDHSGPESGAQVHDTATAQRHAAGGDRSRDRGDRAVRHGEQRQVG